MNNEAYETLKKYFPIDNPRVHFYGSIKELKYFENYLLNGEVHLYDRPDIFITYKDEVLIIEHFEFDCYEKNKKGSKCRIEKSKIDKDFNEFISDIQSKIFIEKINAKCNFNNYINNAMDTFLCHYNKIDDYKSNLINSNLIKMNSRVKVCFLIEESSPIGSGVLDGKLMVPIVLLRCNKFLQTLKEKDKVDYVISGPNIDGKNYVWFYSRSSIDDYINNEIEYEKMQFLDFNINIIGGKSNFSLS